MAVLKALLCGLPPERKSVGHNFSIGSGGGGGRGEETEGELGVQSVQEEQHRVGGRREHLRRIETRLSVRNDKRSRQERERGGEERGRREGHG